jgi:hypothetical protein
MIIVAILIRVIIARQHLIIFPAMVRS